MKKMIRKANEKLMQLYVRSKVLLADNSGASFVDFALYLVIAVVVAALVLAGVQEIFKVKIFPGVSSKIDAMWS